MAKRSQSTPIPIHSSRRRSTVTKTEIVLADLEARFARLRAKHARGTRVPRELREAALAAVRLGVAPGTIYRTCGVSWSQLGDLEGGAAQRDSQALADAARLRVFS